MNNNNNMKRMRGRNHRSGGGGGQGGSGGPVRHNTANIPLNRNHVFDSSGPDLRVRGTAQQLSEKYLQLGRDATSVGDRVMAESYFQHAEHYFRIMGAMQAAQQQQAPQQNQGAHQQAPQQAQAAQRRYQPDEQTDEPADLSIAGLGDQPTSDAREVPIAATAPPDV